jgi:biotin transport system substrate-specific component
MGNTSALKNASMFKGLLLAAFFAALTAVGAVLTVPLPLVPITLQSFFVLMSGLLLGPKYGPLSQALYLAMGLAGLPVFAGGTGGIQRVLSPSFGFLLGYPFVSWATGILSSEKWIPKEGMKAMGWYCFVCFAATALLYAIALPCFYLNMKYVAQTPTSVAKTLQVAFLPFVIGDSIKAVVGGYLAYRMIPVLRGSGLSIDRIN